jgi:hypothetical protein
MPKVSRESAQTDDHGLVEDRHAEFDGYTVNFVTFRQEMDGAPMLKGLPDDSCQCPHWGYVFKGKVTFRFADHEEVVEAGDAFYLPPGHVPVHDADTEYLQFSPTKELQETSAQIMKNMQAMQGA